MGTGVFAPWVWMVVRLAVLFALGLFLSGCSWLGGPSLLGLVPGDTNEVLVLDVEEVREVLEEDAPWAHDVLSERLESLLGDVSWELEYGELGELVWAGWSDGGGSVLVLGGDFAFDWVREDWEELGWDQGGYRGHEVWGDRAALLEGMGLVVHADALDSLRSSLRLLGRGGRSAADADGSHVGRVLERLGEYPLAVAFEETSSACADAVPGCLWVGVGVEGYDGESGEVSVVVVVLFAGERRAESAVRAYDGVEEVMEDVLYLVGGAGEDFGGYRLDGVYLEDIEHDGLFAVGRGVVEVEEHEGLVSLRQERSLGIESCEELLKNWMVFQLGAGTAAHFQTIIRNVQSRREECSEDIWNPVAVDAADHLSGDFQCFWHDVGMGGPLVGESEVPSGLRADGLADGDLPVVSGRDLENNIIVFWSSAWAERPGDGAVCWMYVAADRRWYSSY